jgi:uncharacterized protein YodC (DUF2158 family)
MSNKFNVGDVVGLKSGGPILTVNAVEDGQYACVWFDDEVKLNSGWFNEATLDLIDITKFPEEYRIQGAGNEFTTTG